jgi:hypothetical protein
MDNPLPHGKFMHPMARDDIINYSGKTGNDKEL